MSTLPPWLLLAITAGLASNAFNFLSRFILKDKDDPTAYAWYFETLRFVIFAVLAVADWKLVVNTYSITVLALIGISEWILVYWLMKMHAFTHLSISSILSRMRLIWVPIIAYFLIQERLTQLEYLGIIILFAGLSIVVAPKRFFVDKGATYANLSAFMIAFNIVLVKMELPYASNSVINAAMALPAVILIPVFMKNTTKRIPDVFKKNLVIKLLAIGFNVISIYLFMFALRLGDAGVVTAVYQGMLVFAVLAGIIFLNERENIGKKLAGTFITLIGVFLLSSS